MLSNNNNTKNSAKKYLLFPGCLIKTRLPWLERTTMLVLTKLGINYILSDELTCCFDPVRLKSMDLKLWLAIAARNLALAEAIGAELLTLCNGCFASLNEAQRIINTWDKLADTTIKALKSIGRTYKGNCKITSITELFYNLCRERKLVSNDDSSNNRLKDVKLTTHHGCHFFTGSRSITTYQYPVNNLLPLDFIASEVAGCTVVKYWKSHEVCCGSGLSATEPAVAKELATQQLKLIVDAEVDYILTCCPFCFMQLDLTKVSDGELPPVLYITEFIGLALGIHPKQLGFKFHKRKSGLVN